MGHPLMGHPGTNAYGLLDVFCAFGFGIAILKRRLWGAYGLVILAAGSVAASAYIGKGTPWLVPLIVYLIGAFVLRHC